MIFFKSAVIFLSLFLLISCDYKSKKKHNFKQKNKRLHYKASDHLIEVEIENGVVQGSKMSDYIYAFRGIPFAKPPIGKLRFEPPEKPDNWSGIWNATYDRSPCVQSDISNVYTIIYPNGNEDCLYINVYTPKLQDEDDLLPVMVWIYGGGFIGGGSSYDLYGPDYLCQKGVMVVSFNYRLGVFGFLSTNDEAAPGNIGLKDQIAALKWVKSNIKAFGGDPDKVTVFGESAGSASVSYLMLSPLAKGLFKNAIMESGTALCLWSLSRTARKAAYKVGLALGIKSNNSKELVNELKKVRATDLQRASVAVEGLILAQNPLNGLVYTPVVEPPHDGAVITDYSYELLMNGDFNHVPSIIGFNSAEAEGFSELLRSLQLYLLSYDLIPSRLVPFDMNAAKTDLNSIGQQIKVHYSGQHGRLTFAGDNFTRFFSDNEFVRPILKTAELTSKYSKVYLYKFSYNEDKSISGAGHAAEMPYIFKSSRNNTNDIKIRECMTSLWTDFAKYSNPTPSVDTCGGIIWNPVEPSNRDKIYYINIDTNSTMGENPNQKDVDFWQQLYNKQGNPPYSTY